jgi:hypothetical protein
VPGVGAADRDRVEDETAGEEEGRNAALVLLIVELDRFEVQ